MVRPSALPRLAAVVEGTVGAPVVTFVPGIGNDVDFWLSQARALIDSHRTLRFHPWGVGRVNSRQWAAPLRWWLAGWPLRVRYN